MYKEFEEGLVVGLGLGGLPKIGEKLYDIVDLVESFEDYVQDFLIDVLDLKGIIDVVYSYKIEMHGGGGEVTNKVIRLNKAINLEYSYKIKKESNDKEEDGIIEVINNIIKITYKKGVSYTVNLEALDLKVYILKYLYRVVNSASVKIEKGINNSIVIISKVGLDAKLILYLREQGVEVEQEGDKYILKAKANKRLNSYISALDKGYSKEGNICYNVIKDNKMCIKQNKNKKIEMNCDLDLVYNVSINIKKV